MEIIRQIVILLISFGFAGYLLSHVFYGIKNGQIHHSDSTKVCKKEEKPFMFWAIVTLFLLFSFISLWFGYRSLETLTIQ